MNKIERGLIFAAVLSLAFASGCSSTVKAYKAADGLEETAYVMNQHFLALVREANDLADAGDLAGSDLTKAQSLVRESRPLISQLSVAAQAYESVRNADSEEALTDAIARAAVVLSDLVNVIRAVGGSAHVPIRLNPIVAHNNTIVMPFLSTEIGGVA